MFFYLLVIGILFAHFFLRYKHFYWKRRGIAQVNPEFLFGNLKELMVKNHNFDQTIEKCYHNLKQKGEKHGGIYLFYTPIWIVTDIQLIKQIMTTDFDYFNSHGLFHHEKDWMSNHLLNLEGEKWKELRGKLTPTFTSGKLKGMFSIMEILGDRMEKKIADYCSSNQPIEMKEHSARFGIDVVAACFFGLECDCLNNPDSELRETGKLIVKSRFLSLILENTFSWNLLGNMGYTFFPKEVSNFFVELTRKTVGYREKNNVSRNDYLQLLIQLKNQTKPGQKELLTFEEMIANMMLMYAAGFETSSSATIFLLYELAKNQEIQDKLRDEILSIVKNSETGKITYEQLNEMKYADACITESLRRYPPIPEVPRKCVKKYQIPGTNVSIEKGTRILIPAMAIQNDPEFFSDPHKFNPDNFLDDNKKNNNVSFLAFGGGPRFCIGYKFAYMHVKFALTKYLTNFKYSLNPKTPRTLSYKTIALSLTAKEEILLDVTPINKN